MPYASSADIRSAATSEWEAATGHRLFREVIADSISDEDFERYLRIEFAGVGRAWSTWPRWWQPLGSTSR